MLKIYGHRGAPAERPENTLASFQRALEAGVYGIELDVHLSKDGVPVVIHDETLDRTTNATGNVSEFTVDELREVDAGQGEYVPTLAEVLDLVGGEMHVDIEIKANAAGRAVLDEMRFRSEMRWLISSFDWDVLRYVRSVDAEIELWVLTPGASDEALDTVREVGATALAIWERGMDADVAGYLRDEGIAFWPWTVNDPARAAELVSWGAIGICTDDPAGISNALTGYAG